MNAILSFTLPVMLEFIIDWIVRREATIDITTGATLEPLPYWWGWCFLAGAVLAQILGSFFYYHALMRGHTLGLRLRAVLTTLVYQKALRLPPSKSRNTGQIVNLVASDTQLLSDTLVFFNQGFIAPIQIIVTTGLIGRHLGAYCLIPLGVLIIAFPFVGFISSRIGVLRSNQQKATDDRVKLVKELISAVRIVKYYAWEKPFKKNIDKFRKTEVKWVMRGLLNRAGMIGVLVNVPAIGIGLTFFFYGLNNNFSPKVIFPALSLLNLLRSPFTFLPIMFAMGSQYAVTFDRIFQFANGKDLPKRPSETAVDSAGKKKLGKTAIRIKKGDFTWTPEDPDAKVTLTNVNISVKRGETIMVVGSVGSGKSSIGMAVLGEIPKLKGEVAVDGTVAYVAQEAWIINATVRDNILFGAPFDEKKYNKVLQMAALIPDLAILSAGDMTEIGDRGINLSGGQKQRVSIARALYADRDVYIFDDPFSAVDSHVAQHLVENVVRGWLRKQGKTAFVITNQLQFLPAADKIILMKNGLVAETGTFDELQSNGKEFSALVAEFGITNKPADDSEESSTSESHSKLGASSDSVKEGKKVTADERKKLDEAALKAGNLTGNEEQEEGNIGWRIYWYYIKSGGIGLFLLGLLFLAAGCGIRVYYSIWLADWSTAQSLQLYLPVVYNASVLSGLRANLVNATGAPISDALFSNVTGGLAPATFVAPPNIYPPQAYVGRASNVWYGAYLGMVFIETFAMVGRQILNVFWGRNASIVVHSALMTSIVRATTSFFDMTPMGRLLTRFSKDIGLIDQMLPGQFSTYVDMVFNLLSAFANMATTSPYILIAVAVGAIAYYIMQAYYRKTSIEIQRLESVSRAPIFSHLNETLEGAQTIRAYGMEHRFKVANMNKIDHNSVDFIALRYCSMWFGLRLDFFGTLIMGVTFLAIVLLRLSGSIDVSLASLALSSTTGITFMLSALSMNAAELETRMNSVERILQYTEIEQEAPEFIDDNRPDKTWPQKGKVEFKELSIAYKTGPLDENGNHTYGEPVLKKVSAVIKPKEKIGIVGRTGAGKSTLITALFRLVEPVHGTTLIDGVDINKIGLTDLRTKLSIIPQMPVLFIGTVRYNVDPFNEKQDDDIWHALKLVGLSDYITSLSGKLDAAVEENGQNFSVGQRQLLAMARALLRNAHILLLDEATAAVDNETDAMIQKMVRKNFSDRTVITIAHRLNTIMDYDRIMVLDKGKLIEFDSPANLLKDSKGIFTSMVDATGPDSAAHLRDIANGKASVDDDISEEADKKKKSGKHDKKKSSSSRDKKPKSSSSKQDVKSSKKDDDKKSHKRSSSKDDADREKVKPSSSSRSAKK
jgi:ABC-type multidrug transport system fused ATPase/permease subunit